MSQHVTEAAASPKPTGTGRLQIGLITPGWGSSGYYSPQVLENAANDKIWAKGTHVYFDHPSESELYDRPERSVRDLAAVLDEDAHWDGTGLVAEASVIGPYRDLVTDPVFIESVGMSIRAGAETTTGEADGRKGTIVTRLTEGISVDLVTHAGRGGKVLAVIESARAAARETLTGETRDLLQLAVAAPDYVRDFDPDKGLVIYQHIIQDDENGYQSELLQDGYTINAGIATLKGKPKPVRQAVSYTPVKTAAESAIRLWGELGVEPITENTNQIRVEAKPSAPKNVPAPAGQPENTPTPNVQEDTMGTIQVDEAEHGRLTEAAGRVPTLESERDTAIQERDQACEALAQRDRVDAARTIIHTRAREAEVTFTALETRGLLAQLPVTDAGVLDEAAFTATVDEAVKDKTPDTGVHGFGASVHTGDLTEADIDKAIAGAFGRTIKEA